MIAIIAKICNNEGKKRNKGGEYRKDRREGMKGKKMREENISEKIE